MSHTDTADDANSNGQEINTYTDLFRAFCNGARSGQHRKVEIRDDGTRTLLVAYDTWVYATREKGSGSITAYTRWSDKDRATTASNIQFGYFEQALDAHEQELGLASLFLVEREDRIVDIEDNEYDSFTVDAQPA